jgi:hypothetical protein
MYSRGFCPLTLSHCNEGLRQFTSNWENRMPRFLGTPNGDVIVGTNTDDLIRGFDGDDLLIGGGGDDAIFGGNGMDTLLGGQGNDQLSGGGGDDILFGGAGDDVLIGGGGNDMMAGGAGSDTYVVSGGSDTVVGFNLAEDMLDFNQPGTDVTDFTFVSLGPNSVQITGPGLGTLTVNGPGVGTALGIAALQASSAYCFMAGTAVATPDGERPIESLSIGDLVSTHDGRAMPVRWLGRQTVCTLFADKLRTLPIRIAAGALGDNMPARDLLVSPDHALFLDGVLVQAGALVNGLTITRETKVPAFFTYYHVELADHSLMLAENTPAETFIDNVDRMAFDNWAEHEALYGNEAALLEMNLPRAKSHRQVPGALRRRLAQRAGDMGLVPQAA